jgi:hypothetical protein
MKVLEVIEKDEKMRLEIDLNQEEMDIFANIAIRDLLLESTTAMPIQEGIKEAPVTLSIDRALFNSLMEITVNKSIIKYIKSQENLG